MTKRKTSRSARPKTTKTSATNNRARARQVSWLAYNWPLVSLLLIILICLLVGSFALDFYRAQTTVVAGTPNFAAIN